MKGIVVGASAGGLDVLDTFLSALPGDFGLPLLVVQHLPPTEDGTFARLLDERCALPVKEAEDREPVTGGRVYLAPPGYHLLLERSGVLSLSVDERVRFARPSVDVLFESAASAWGEGCVALVLTGANDDGARGAKRIESFGGLVLVQDPSTAHAEAMPRGAIASCPAARLLAPGAMAPALVEIWRDGWEVSP